MNNLKILLAASQDWTKEYIRPASHNLPELQAELKQKFLLKMGLPTVYNKSLSGVISRGA